jgi:NADH:ubiquinone oxidoreductase subunit E
LPTLEDLVEARFQTSGFPLGGSTVSTREEPPLHEVDAIVARIGTGEDSAIAILQEIQDVYGYLPDQAMERVAQITDISPAQIAGTSTFYTRFRRSPRGDHLVRICVGTACHVSGAQHIDEELRRQLDIPAGEDTDPARRFTLTPVACLGCCSLAPVIMVDEHTVGRLTPGKVANTLRQLEEEA